MSRSAPAQASVRQAPVTSRRVLINELELSARIGVYDQERLKAQPIRITVDLEVSLGDEPLADQHSAVVCYHDIVRGIETLVEGRHINLVEVLAEEIADLCLQDRRVISARVLVEKLRAIAGARSVGAEISKIRSFMAD